MPVMFNGKTFVIKLFELNKRTHTHREWEFIQLFCIGESHKSKRKLFQPRESRQKLGLQLPLGWKIEENRMGRGKQWQSNLLIYAVCILNSRWPRQNAAVFFPPICSSFVSRVLENWKTELKGQRTHLAAN